MRRLPIRLRVTAALALALALVLAGSGWLLYVRLGDRLDAALDRDLRLRAQDLSALLAEPRASLAGDARGRLIEKGESYAEVVDAHGRVLDATPPLAGRTLLTGRELARARRSAVFAVRSSVPGLDEPSRLLAVPLAGSPGHVLVVGATRQDRAETLAGFKDELLVAGPIALALAALAGYFLVGLALRPVESMRRRAAEISAETPGERLPVPATGDEVERLGTTLNEMLARLEAALARERDFVADAGHELRTPLALLRTELELALRHAESVEELREAVGRSSLEVERLVQLAEHLLLIARSDQGDLPLRREPLVVADVLGAVAQRFSWRADQSGRRLEVAVPARLEVDGDRIRLEQALANLVDNALRYGQGDVQLSATGTGSTVELCVVDGGMGFPPELLPRAFERFARADQARTGGGAGLGLAIVRMVVEAHGGTAHASNLDGKGAVVRLVIPAVQARFRQVSAR